MTRRPPRMTPKNPNINKAVPWPSATSVSLLHLRKQDIWSCFFALVTPQLYRSRWVFHLPDPCSLHKGRGVHTSAPPGHSRSRQWRWTHIPVTQLIPGNISDLGIQFLCKCRFSTNHLLHLMDRTESYTIKRYWILEKTL